MHQLYLHQRAAPRDKLIQQVISRSEGYQRRVSMGQITDACCNLQLHTAFGNTHERVTAVRLWAGQLDGCDLIEIV